ncbi:hypothetical protein CXG81DRAFT_15404 [Caulochytrium protostelioides]|uniref:Myosin motor domain-containing protein n=1 Tax=Caulochytrium protostelioides TaxID=1555241 RepID=A0A4P9X2P3_9FUNG|nr:hypothetical protein CXG81DRAFT_15404 [Caulochytrium protostelioides]|eukprot:RKO98816.1 hypothetical protein CXG81DRAFT_15404 [Caulochytrium protostelioides]
MVVPFPDEKAFDAYVVGTKAWFPDEEEGWVVGTLTSKAVEGGKLLMAFHPEGGAASKSKNKDKPIVFERTLDQLQASKFADLPPLKNPPILEGIDDLANLSYLHEPEVLHNVRIRYMQEQIYTYSGIVLIAMNPFSRLAIYSPEIMREYSGKRRGELEPHLFAVAEEAYRTMITERRNQSIIVSGESGAGKTQSAKYIMRYFAIVDDLTKQSMSRSSSLQNDMAGVADGDKSSAVGSRTEIEQAVLSTNPIMESFGNSKTTRNDNSSRFGKYIEILFTPPDKATQSVSIIGATIRTYLLERSRLIFQPANERNYHIFYQLCAATPAAERKELGLGPWDSFFYLNQGGVGVVPGIDDAAEFAITQKALSTIGISVSAQWDIFRICAALLHIGNIKITANRDQAAIASDDAALVKATELLGLDRELFKKWITHKQIITRSEKIVTSLNAYQAVTGRDSVAKFIYSTLFDWLVKLININLRGSDSHVHDTRFIGVLDIYGFEHFKRNSFEQFCINYANEKLQQEFNQHVFKLEQEEYVAEQISWSFIDFNDNQPCIDMIEGKLGILDLLDEESRMPSGADANLINKLYTRFAPAEHKFFEKPRFGQAAFTIKHYATDVTYETDGFIEKNKDTVSDEQLQVLSETSFAFLKEVIATVPQAAASATPQPPTSGRPSGSSATKKPTLGSIFKGSLVQLMDTIRSTDSHYIRCIKPNQAKKAFGFESQMVLQQLRACGVLETIRISCAGYPSRWTYQEFADRYYLLIHSRGWVEDARAMALAIVSASIHAEDKYQMGLTKIFFRAGQLAFLEKLRTERLRACVVTLQKNMRRVLYQRRFLAMRAAAIRIQTAYRGHRARQEATRRRQTAAAVRLQTAVRAWLARHHYQNLRRATLFVQAIVRAKIARRERLGRDQRDAVQTIQRVWRGHRARREVRRVLARVILIQSCIRRRRAIREIAALRVEARSVGKLKETNYKLEGKLVELSQQLQAKQSEERATQDHVSHLEAQLASLKDKYAAAFKSSKSAQATAAEDLSGLKHEVSKLRSERDQLQKENDKMTHAQKRTEEELAALQTTYAAQKDAYDKLRKDIKMGKLKTGDDKETEQLRKDVASLRDQVGKLLAGKWKNDRVADQLLAETQSPGGSSVGGLPDPLQAQARHRRHSLEGILSPTASHHRLNRGSMMLDGPALFGETDERNAPEIDRGTRALEDPGLAQEMTDQLITNLRIPLPSTQSVATKKEIFFPAHLMGLVMSQYLKNHMSQQMVEVMTGNMMAIQALTTKFEDDYVSAFWLSNCFELLCIVKTAQETHARENRKKRPNLTDVTDKERALDQVRQKLDYLLIEIYHGWIRELKKRLSNMIVPAVIENQSLPGYICKQMGGLWGKWGKATQGTPFTIEQLLNFLSKLAKTMRCYYMEESMSRQILTEFLRVIGVSSFNHLLMRKNFCTWKRGVQIQYNVSRLEEWCTGHGIAEATLHLQQLLQAAKLLTLNKTSPQDIETIFDVCFLLNPTQIKKLLSLYYAADFDSPLSPELLNIAASRAILNEKSDSLLLDLEQAPDFTKPPVHAVHHLDKFIPSWTSLPHLTSLITIAANSIA